MKAQQKQLLHELSKEQLPHVVILTKSSWNDIPTLAMQIPYQCRYVNLAKELITDALSVNNTKYVWRKFWLKLIVDSIVMKHKYSSSEYHVRTINEWCQKNNEKLVFIFSDLEVFFPDTKTSIFQQEAISSLLDIPQRITEINNSNIGIIIVINHELAKNSIEQNFGQFENLYREFVC
jgi:hypothetical protein